MGPLKVYMILWPLCFFSRTGYQYVFFFLFIFLCTFCIFCFNITNTITKFFVLSCLIFHFLYGMFIRIILVALKDVETGTQNSAQIASPASLTTNTCLVGMTLRSTAQEGVGGASVHFAILQEEFTSGILWVHFVARRFESPLIQPIPVWFSAFYRLNPLVWWTDTGPFTKKRLTSYSSGILWVHLTLVEGNYKRVLFSVT